MTAMTAGTSRCSRPNVNVSWALWAGALSCRKITKSPENCTDIRQHLLFQQHVLITRSIYFDARVHEREVDKETASFSCPKITAFPFIVLAK